MHSVSKFFHKMKQPKIPRYLIRPTQKWNKVNLFFLFYRSKKILVECAETAICALKVSKFSHNMKQTKIPKYLIRPTQKWNKVNLFFLFYGSKKKHQQNAPKQSFVHSKFQNFPGGACPHTPLATRRPLAPHLSPPTFQFEPSTLKLFDNPETRS